jgi:nucleoside-diphosphate-sugar epimerase
MKKINLENKKVLIVGGAGFIGHNLALKLKELKADVNIIDGMTVNNLYSLENNTNQLPYPKLAMKIINERQKLLKKNGVPLIIQDAREYHKLCQTIENIKPQIIIHLAAVSHANRSNKDPHSTFDHSLRTLENVLDNAKKNVEHFIFLSSSMVYGNFKKPEVTENDICEPLGIYAALKYSAEKIIKAYNQTFDLPYTILRPSALYGERCISRRVGQIFIESALNDAEIKIQGDGNEKLDFTYIEDLVGGIVSVLESKNSINETFNITYGESRSINTLLSILKKEFKNIRVSYEKRDKLMPIRGTLSTAKAIKLMGYSSKWSLENGYPRYINWYKSIFKS